MQIKLPTKTLEYLLMGMLAGLIAAIVLITIFGATASAIQSITTNIKISTMPKP